MEKKELQEAYEAGVASVKLNKDRDELLERGTKQICEEYSFQQWYSTRELIKNLNTPFEIKGKRCPNGCAEFHTNIGIDICLACKSKLIAF